MAKIPRDFHKAAINSKLRKNFLSFALYKRRILVCWIEARIRFIYILIFLYLEYTLGDIMWWREISFLWDSHNKLYIYFLSCALQNDNGTSKFPYPFLQTSFDDAEWIEYQRTYIWKMSNQILYFTRTSFIPFLCIGHYISSSLTFWTLLNPLL